MMTIIVRLQRKDTCSFYARDVDNLSSWNRPEWDWKYLEMGDPSDWVIII